MNQPFGAYSRYYDLLYRDKDYQGEAQYIQSLLNRFAPHSKRLLELGCGTGKHAAHLSGAGYEVVGVERSESMVAQALNRQASLAKSVDSGSFQVVCDDATTVRLHESFDAVLSLFHVVSYQTANNQVQAMFDTANAHLADNGIFLFDVWYGPAVLMQMPTVRIKRIEDDGTQIVRLAEPTINLRQNIVDVYYTVFVCDKATQQFDTFTESHSMRYFFEPELELFARQSGMTLIHCEPWLGNAEVSDKTWGVTFLAQKSPSTPLSRKG